eukprot:CAMPEP_0113460350 /NCGR_PEP_ID=MMETSP0014_2-20120614/10939_1 /TAXON_ID=2857 /ORGANISM="Nitzschia sp." /LENGTH=160 /DNA_ID=CAMNT_0000351995 /DNA_START=154 /DNA_END=636 /DNA_ORIENTATION=+ /assembly_acc=CAM_ASM_000159
MTDNNNRDGDEIDRKSMMMVMDMSNNVQHVEEQQGYHVEEDNDQDENSEDGEDEFNSDAIPLPRLSSSTIPIIIDVSGRHRHSTGFYSSNDPLFQGVCLYSSSSTASKSNSSRIETNSKDQSSSQRDTDRTQKSSSSSASTNTSTSRLFGLLNFMHSINS